MRKPPTPPARTTHFVKLGAVALLGGLSGALWLHPTEVSATPVPAAKQVTAPAAGMLDAGIPGDAGVAAPAVESESTATTATIVFSTIPATTAVVTWGRKQLGRITPGTPLVVVRPRDSGPLDVVVRAIGYLPVQTRAHTFSDTRVQVKLTPPENVSELLGYRLPLDGGLEGGLGDASLVLDGGIADDGGAMPMPAPDATVPFQTVPSTPASPWLIQ